MQSSPLNTALRALTMLACAVGITALAMSGTSWSKILEKYRNLDWPAAWTGDSVSPREEQNAVGRLARAGRTGETPTLPPSNEGGGNDDASDYYRGAVVPVALTGETPSSRAFDPRPPFDRMEYQDIQDRLQALGSTYYLLETWGNRRRLYRFSCKIAVGGNADYTRYFEATDADPLQSMLLVLRQVETWRER